MFSLIRIASSLVGFVILSAIAVYFLPHDIKVKTLESVSGFVPQSIKDKTEELFLTPPESREKLIKQIEGNLNDIRSASKDEVDVLVAKSQQLIASLKEKNYEESLPQIIKEKLVDQFLHASSTPQCVK